jgi:hypothetical protein
MLGGLRKIVLLHWKLFKGATSIVNDFQDGADQVQSTKDHYADTYARATRCLILLLAIYIEADRLSEHIGSFHEIATIIGAGTPSVFLSHIKY